MPTTRPAGSEPLPATLGGKDWRPRVRSHAEELGDLWAACGCQSEYGRLRSVLLAWPGEELDVAGPPNQHLLLDRVSIPAIRQQAEEIAAAYTACGVAVHFYRPVRRPPPNLIFMRDLFFMTPEGAVVGRTASEQRAGEERFAAQALATVGIPILATVRGLSLFEGADALWLDPKTVLLAVGQRTNSAGADTVAGVLRDLGIDSRRAELPAGTQHLVGVLNGLDAGLAAVDAGRLTPEFRGILGEHGYRLVECTPGEELVQRRGMNFVAVAPSAVLMPAECPGIRARLEAAGVSVHEVVVSEYLKAAGGLACLTGILARDPVAAGVHAASESHLLGPRK